MSNLFEDILDGGFVGLDDKGQVGRGYDQTLAELEEWTETPMSREEKLIVADEMLARWARYRADVMRQT